MRGRVNAPRIERINFRTRDVTIVQPTRARGAGLEHSVPGGGCRAVRMVAVAGAEDDEFGLLAKACGGSPR
jgi:hypothetical protein